MNILILNWRDIKNPTGGGAEILTHEIAKRWVKYGHNVTQYSSAYPNALRNEVLDGVTFIRRGHWWTVHFYAFIFYLKNKKSFDVIIDEVHWFPFFAAVYTPRKTIALTCEVATKLLYKIFPYPVAYAFSLLEKLYLSLYRNVPTMVISPSTRDDLISSGHSKKNIIVLPMGLTLPKGIKLQTKESQPTLISVGRLNKQKGTLDVIEAFAIIHKSLPSSKLWLVGSGAESVVVEIKKRLEELKLEKEVKLWGFVTEKEKFSLLSRSHILISASKQEGWGLTIPEAGMMKTPSVVYNIPGFRDIIVQNKTGILTKTNAKDLALETITLLKDKKKHTTMQNNSYLNAKLYSWDKTATVSIEYIKSCLKA